uniref:Major facilitator superfamily multidrug transporter NAG4 (N-acetylglucosamine utilization protein 4) (Transmembrane protein 2) n=1 Tax=Ganoderma boninense TaxID=34458 RepID=A0A5K1K7L8_9APHY|nr:Major facilitator superfamily multidrug transporter NAG4 (N-acetylglucosamine utilization protein 4) (Transmembrane protein 2) [Ganoderma boninense]
MWNSFRAMARRGRVAAHARSEEDDTAMKEDDPESTETEEEEEMELEPEEQEPEEEEMAEAAAALALPKYPVAQMDRAAVLTAFRSSRDRESYEHTNIWDNH